MRLIERKIEMTPNERVLGVELVTRKVALEAKTRTIILEVIS